MTQRAADIRVAWPVYVRTYCVSIATWNQNKRTRLLYLGDAQNNKIFDPAKRCQYQHALPTSPKFVLRLRPFLSTKPKNGG